MFTTKLVPMSRAAAPRPWSRTVTLGIGAVVGVAVDAAVRGNDPKAAGACRPRGVPR